MDQDLARLDAWLAPLVSNLKPAARRRLALKIGQAERRLNAQRIAANVDPDGAPMEKRKKKARRAEAKAGRVRRTGRMFPRIGKIRALKVRPSPDGVEIGFASPLVEQTAQVHHFGLDGYVGKTRTGQQIRTRYPERRLLGFGANDEQEIMDLALDHLQRR